LSPRQREILDVLAEEVHRNGQAPTLKALGARLGGLSPASVHLHLAALAAKGFVRWPRGRPQEVELLQPAQELSLRGLWRVPVMGTIAAGLPIDIDGSQTPEDYVVVEAKQLRGVAAGTTLFALRVQGDSMVDACIQDGDLVVIRRQETAQDGDTVVALIERSRATLKRLYREAGRIRLAPANPYYPDIHVAAEDVQVQGKVVGVVRYC
jgi:repressor LexA